MARYRIEADQLLPGRGDPIRDAVVAIDGSTIAYAGPARAAPTDPGASRYHVATVMPGMWEAHGHFYGTAGNPSGSTLDVPSEVAIVRTVGDVQLALRRGFTSVREAGGGLGFALARLVDEGTVEGPAIYPSGPFLSATGGHGDIHALPTTWIRDLCTRGGAYHLCDGVPACLEAVRLQLRLGARVLKVCTTGGLLGTIDDPECVQFSDEELRAIVGEASRHNVAVMAHAHGKRGILAAVRAGCATIEHGTCIDDEVAEEMLRHGTMLVPTALAVQAAQRSLHQLPSAVAQRVRSLAARHAASMTLAHRAGIPIALGTDVAHWSSDPNSVMPWGTSGSELSLLVRAGLSPLEAIEAATANGPRTLGGQAPRSGELRAGYDADVLGLSTDPLEDLGRLADGSAVTHVWRAGRLVQPNGCGSPLYRKHLHAPS